ncbi:hypothetical protein [Actinomadura litoris]|uniref:hypothetical protein n=1 Tax=Actinomadura litoris TaxID=2678616 RepID=UPI001FA700B3|nr:hypothetical protein [Actinomadura litoris]
MASEQAFGRPAGSADGLGDLVEVGSGAVGGLHSQVQLGVYGRPTRCLNGAVGSGRARLALGQDVERVE